MAGASFHKFDNISVGSVGYLFEKSAMPYKNQILDDGELKSIKHYKRGMNNKKERAGLESRYEYEYTQSARRAGEGQHSKDATEMEIYHANKHYQDVHRHLVPPHEMTTTMLYEYYNIIPYRPCWMLNISPNWKGPKCGKNIETCRRVSFIREVMNLFATDADRFTKMTYVIEGGKEGNFIHVHAIFRLNHMKPNNLAHMKKGNFLKSFRTIWDSACRGRDIYNKWEGAVGSRYALQTTYLTTQEMLNDKLDYLIEEKKPISHQNHPDFKSIKVGEWD